MLQEHRREVLEMSEMIYRQWFALLSGAVSPSKQKGLLERFGSAKHVFDCSEKALMACSFLKDKDVMEISASKKRGLPLSQAEEWKKQGIGFVCLEEDSYPGRVRETSGAPYALWYKGELPADDIPTVGIIGARNCSDYGRRSAAYFGAEMAKAGVNVISGMAVGIDGISQSACIDNGGKSYGCLGSGPDVIYPRANTELYQNLIKHGGVVSEFYPGTESKASNFPMRNRIISAFSDILLVIEAREKSGTFITVGYALEQGRDVYALPGRIDDALSAGCNRLIRDGAGIASCADDIIFELNGMIQAHRKHISTDGLSMAERMAEEKKMKKREKTKPEIPECEDPLDTELLRLLSEHEYEPEMILERIKQGQGELASTAKDLTLQALMGHLINLQMEDRISNRGNMYFLI